MSAYVVDKVTIDEIVSSMVQYGLIDEALADNAGSVLANENLRSFHYRYPAADSPMHIEYEYRPPMATLGQRARSLTNYAYQSNEYPGWSTSEARAMCLRLAFAFLTEIPGYHEADAR